MKTRRIIFPGILVLCIALNTFSMKLTTNLAPNDFYGGLGLIWKNALNASTDWKAVDIDSGTYDSLVQIPTDSLGYPLEIPYAYNGGSYGLQSYALVEIAQQAFPFGTFTLSFEGTGTIVLEDLHNKTISGNGGKTSYEFTLNEPSMAWDNLGQYIEQPRNLDYLKITITASSRDNPIRNLKLIIPDEQGGTSYVATEPTQPFTPVFLRRLKPYSIIRYSHFSNANYDTTSEWVNRFPLNHLQTEKKAYQGGTRTVAWEHMIQLSNLTQTDMWISIPVYANDDYITRLATLIKDNLAPHLNVWLEYGNETWNGMFIGYQAAIDISRAHSLSPVDKDWQHNNYGTTYQLIHCGEIFESIFGSEKDRVIPVLSGWENNITWSELRVQALSDSKVNPNNYTVEHFATTAYFNTSSSVDILLAPGGNWRLHADLCQDSTLKYISYEGGHGGSMPIADLPDAYNYALAKLDTVMDVFAQFTYCQPWSTYRYGSLQYITQPLDEAPKYKTLFDYAVANTSFTASDTANIDFIALAEQYNGNFITIEKPTTSPPTITPNSGTYRDPVQLSITAPEAGSEIYYTLNGSNPTSGSTLFTGNITLYDTTTIKAIAILPEQLQSDIVSATLNIDTSRETTAAPQISPSILSHFDSLEITLSSETEGADIFYTLDNSTPSDSSTPYTGPFTITSNTTIKTIAIAPDMHPSAITVQSYTITPRDSTVAPLIVPITLTHYDSVEITLSSATDSADIYYTLDNSTPSDSSSPYTGPFTITSNTTIKTIAIAPDMHPSAITVQSYTITPRDTTAAPEILPITLTHYDSVEITLSSATDSADIYYTLDNTEPDTTSKKYAAPFYLTSTTTIKAIAAATDLHTSPVSSQTFTVTPRPTAPNAVISPNGYNGKDPVTVTVTLTLADSLSNAEIHYTLNDSTPTELSPVYDSAITLHDTTTVKARVYIPDYHPGEVVTALFNIDTTTVDTADTTSPLVYVANPVITPNGGTFTSVQEITVTSTTADARIYYTLDESDPDTSSTLFETALSLSESATVKVRAFKDGFEPSSIVSAVFSIDTSSLVDPVPTDTPEILADSTTFEDSLAVTITGRTEAVQIFYTLNGDIPDSTASEYTDTFFITKSCTLKAIAYEEEYLVSTIASKAFTKTIKKSPLPIVDTTPETVTEITTVDLDSLDEGVRVFYTLDGSDPDSNDLEYTGPLYLWESQTIKFRSYTADREPSEIVTREYTVTIPQITINKEDFIADTRPLFWRPLGYSFVLKDQSPLSVLSSLGDADPAIWRLARWHNGAYRFLEAESERNFQFHPGKMYWLVTRDSVEIPTPSGFSTSYDSLISMTIPGKDWLDFTLPYTINEGVTFKDILTYSSISPADVYIYAYENGAFKAVSDIVDQTMSDSSLCKPGSFYIALNNTDDDLELQFPPIPQSKSNRLKKAKSSRPHEGNWGLEISVQGDDGIGYGNLFIGNRYHTAAGKKEYLQPVPALNKTQASFSNQANTVIYTSANKQVQQEKMVIVNSNAVQQNFVVSTSIAKTLPEHSGYALFDYSAGKWISESDNSFTISLQKGAEYAFAVFTGPRDALDNTKTLSLQKPKVNLINDNRGVLVTVNHPLYSQVSMRLLDLAGRTVYNTLGRHRLSVPFTTVQVSSSMLLAHIIILDEKNKTVYNTIEKLPLVR